MKKDTVIKILDLFEDEFTVEELIEKLLFIDKIEAGLEDVKHGKVYLYNNVKEKYAGKR